MCSDDNMRNVLAVVLAGGAGERLHPLTRHDAKPAVPFGGMYRIIDFTLSNCLNSDLRKILILVQYKSLSLSQHIRGGWDVLHPDNGEFIEVIPAQQRVGDKWYQGTADAIHQNLYSIEPVNADLVMILSGDHIYKMNYQKMVAFHRRSGADMTVAAIETPTQGASRFGILELDTDTRVIGFEEKPPTPRSSPYNPDVSLASMGIYIFNTDVLREACQDDARRNTSHDFGKDIIPKLIKSHKVYAYMFQDENRKAARYWRDVGTIDSYWEANMDLVSVDPTFNLYDRAWPIRTQVPMAPPAKFVFADEGVRFGAAVDSIVSAGSIISGGTVRRSVIGPDCYVHSYTELEECILLRGADIGRGARLRRTIVGQGVQIPEGLEIGFDLDEDRKHFHVTDAGIVVVDSEHTMPAGRVLNPAVS